MRLLLDTNAVVWWLRGQHERFGSHALEVLAAGTSEFFVSVATVWEASIKRTLGKVPEAVDLLDDLEGSRIALLDITARHADRAGSLTRHHDDPFDRLLVAQAQMENLTLVSSDRELAAYGVDVLW